MTTAGDLLAAAGALFDDDAADREATIVLVTDELDGMHRMVEDLLLLAKARRPDFLEPGEVQVHDLTSEVLHKAGGLAERQWRLDQIAVARRSRSPCRGRPLGRAYPEGGACAMSRILIVEDEQHIASFIDKGLRAHGYTTSTIDDGVEAGARQRESSSTESFELAAGRLTLDLRARVARLDGRDVDLTTREFTMLETFMRHPGHVRSHEQLLSHVWGYDHDPGSNVVDADVRYLRRKLGSELITTVRGMG